MEFSLENLVLALEVCYSIPIIDDVEDFVWEAVWAHLNGVGAPDPLRRHKLLFDVVDNSSKIGWSAKTLVWAFEVAAQCEFVIQRADVFKKADELGFGHLDRDSDPELIGEAIRIHWLRKVQEDSVAQSVSTRKIAILLKDRQRRRFGVIEEELEVPDKDELIWAWTNESKTGLQGRSSTDGQLKYRWYANQKQLFEVLPLSKDLEVISIAPKQYTIEDLLKILHK